MRNITISMDDELARWVRLRAAEDDKSVSRWIADQLRERMAADDRYEQAMRDYFSVEPRPLRAPGEKYPSRDELHDRSGLR